MDLPTMRARVREDLQDVDPSNYRWSDSEIDGAIERAVREFSLQLPLEQQTDLPTTKDDYTIDISSLANLLKVVSVEFPIGNHPPSLLTFEVYMDTLYLPVPGDGENACIRWGKLHTLDASSSTIPTEHEELIVLGATGYLATSASVYTVDRATIAGRYATINFLKWGQQRLERYERKLKFLSRKLTTGRLVTEKEV
jgi:hypothetical protein